VPDRPGFEGLVDFQTAADKMILGKGQGKNRARMNERRADRLFRFAMPHAHGPVGAAGGDDFPIGTEGHGKDAGNMRQRSPMFFEIRGSPKLSSADKTGQERLAVRSECRRQHRIRMFQFMKLFSRGRVPNSRNFVRPPGNQPFSVRAESQSVHLHLPAPAFLFLDGQNTAPGQITYGNNTRKIQRGPSLVVPTDGQSRRHPLGQGRAQRCPLGVENNRGSKILSRKFVQIQRTLQSYVSAVGGSEGIDKKNGSVGRGFSISQFPEAEGIVRVGGQNHATVRTESHAANLGRMPQSPSPGLTGSCIPKARGPVTAARHHQFARGAKSGSEKFRLMLQGGQGRQIAFFEVKDLRFTPQRPLPANQNLIPSRAISHGGDFPTAPVILQQLLAAVHIPQAGRAVLAPTQKDPAARTECQAGN